MFYVFALLLDLSSGQVRPMLDEAHPYGSFAACTESIAARLGVFEAEANNLEARQALALGCLKKKPGLEPGGKES